MCVAVLSARPYWLYVPMCRLHVDKEAAAASSLSGTSVKRLHSLAAHTNEVQQAYQALALRQAQVKDGVEIVSSACSDDQRHLVTASNK